jgi:HSP20 family molecular chaperone IbpA
MDHPHNFQSLRHHLDDPYYSHEVLNGHSHRGVVSPKFDVYGNQTAYFLDGELPGVADKKDIQFEWLANQTLVVSGWIKPVQNKAEWETDPTREAENGTATSTTTATVTKSSAGDSSDEGTDSVASELKTWLRERKQGEFERSFTFPTNIDHEGVKAKLRNGILMVMVPKAPGPNPEQRRFVPIE